MPCGSGGFWGVCPRSIVEQIRAIREPEIYVLRDIEKLADDLKLIRDLRKLHENTHCNSDCQRTIVCGGDLISSKRFLSSPGVYA
jgi:hypothetical protein